MRILAGIVLYNPDLKRLKENVDAIYNQVDTILFVNNGSINHQDVVEHFSGYDNIRTKDNAENLGISTALKQILDYAMDEKFEWVLTLDQDSVCMPGLIDRYKDYMDFESVGILSCNIIDRNFNVETGFQEGQEWKEIKQCITSASLIKVSSYHQTAGFDEILFIDSVDFDICINMRKHGFKIIKINFNGILHEVGHGKNVKLFWKNYITYNHSYNRQYYMARNAIYLARKYPDEISNIRVFLQELRFEILIMLYEKDKRKKILSRWKGVRNSFFMPVNIERRKYARK